MTNPLEIGKNSQPMLHVLDGALQGQFIPLQAPEIRLGREGNGLDLSQYAQMSGLHARIFVENGVWNIQDLGSTKGTYINGEQIISRRLQDGDVLTLGDFTARISLPSQTQDTANTNPAPTQQLPQQSPPAYSPPAGQPTPQHSAPIPPPQPAFSSSLATTGQSFATVALCLMCVGLFPCLGWLNYLTITFGSVSTVLSLIALNTDQNLATRNSAIIGLVLGIVATVVGALRLFMGGGLC